jgi:hypothetical protein
MVLHIDSAQCVTHIRYLREHTYDKAGKRDRFNTRELIIFQFDCRQLGVNIVWWLQNIGHKNDGYYMYKEIQTLIKETHTHTHNTHTLPKETHTDTN